MLENCPPEVLEKIFTFANDYANDGGQTARMLSLVSRYINKSSACVRYRSVTVVGWARMRRFAQVFLGKPSGTILPVIHLFLADHSFGEKGTSWQTRMMDDGACLATHLAQPQMSDMIKLILRAVAPSLRVLVLSLDCPVDFTFLPFALPGLEDLTLLLTHSRPLERIIHPIPSLRRLHIGRLWLGIPVNLIPQLTPNLTHLRFSGLVYLDAFLRKELEAILLSRASTALPPPTTFIYVQLRGRRHKLRAMKEVERFRELIEPGGTDRTVALLEYPQGRSDDRRQGYDQPHAFKDWLDLIGGNQGCWGAKHAMFPDHAETIT